MYSKDTPGKDTPGKRLAKDLGKAGLAFSAGYGLHLLDTTIYSHSAGVASFVPGETWDGFVGFWSQYNYAHLIGLGIGLGLSVIPDKPGSTGRMLAKVAGYGILGSEAWRYAEHTLTETGSRTTAFGVVEPRKLSPLTGAPAGTIPAAATVPPTSFYAADGKPKNFF